MVCYSSFKPYRTSNPPDQHHCQPHTWCKLPQSGSWLAKSNLLPRDRPGLLMEKILWKQDSLLLFESLPSAFINFQTLLGLNILWDSRRYTRASSFLDDVVSFWLCRWWQNCSFHKLVLCKLMISYRLCTFITKSRTLELASYLSDDSVESFSLMKDSEISKIFLFLVSFWNLW